jgi:hypothetical protein
MALTLRRGSWMPVLLLLGGASGLAAVLDLAVGSLTWWLALAGFLALGLALGWIERQRKLAALRPAPERPALRLIDGGKARLEPEVGAEPLEPTETPRWLM